MSDHSPLIPAELRSALPRLYSTEHDPDPLVRAKLFTPWSSWTWFITEFDGDDALFGLVSGHEMELGYFSLAELETLEGPGGLRVERDLHFTPKRLSLVRGELSKLRGDPGGSMIQEARPVYSGAASTAAKFTSAADPFARPAIKLIETQLSSAWSAAGSETIATPFAAAAVLHGMIGEADREHFVALYLNSRHQMTHAHVVSRGTIGSAHVHPREVFKAAVLANAAAVIVGHNHPSGNVQPSAEDNAVVERLKTAGDVLGIKVLDALIVGPSKQFYAASNSACLMLKGATGKGNRAAQPSGSGELEEACQNLLQDIDEVLERQGEEWWGETVTSGTHHRSLAERLLGRQPYARLRDDAEQRSIDDRMQTGPTPQ